jgi:pyruvate formate lyase activating enzyme
VRHLLRCRRPLRILRERGCRLWRIRQVEVNVAVKRAQSESQTAAAGVGLLFDIRRYSVHDGPGIRTTVFFKGCPLSCWWCHNPEGLNPKQNLILFEDRCLSCGDCLAVCPHGAIVRQDGAIHTLPSLCRACGTCVETCPGDARQLAGRWMTVSAVITEIEKDVIFYDESGGGATFSGGEPLAQPRFLDALLEACVARHIHTVVDTCGLADKNLLLHLSEKVNLFLYDLKLLDPVKHRKYVGVSNDSILENLEALAQRKKPVVVRFPVIPNINDSIEDIKQVAEFLSHLGLLRIDLLPYHRIGVEKYRRLGMEYRLEDFEPPSMDHVRQIAARFEREGFAVRIGG